MIFFSTFFSRQARHPSGLFGRFYMSRVFEKGNTELNALVRDTLSLSPHDHVLEIGFGTGALIHDLAGHMDQGLIEGVDLSQTMVSMAKKKNRAHIKNRRVSLHLGDFMDMPWSENRFDVIYTVNTVYFWKKPDQCMEKLHGMLKPQGRLFIGFHHKSDMESLPLNRDIFSYYSTEDMIALYSARGLFEQVEVISRKESLKPCYCAMGSKKD